MAEVEEMAIGKKHDLIVRDLAQENNLVVLQERRQKIAAQLRDTLSAMDALHTDLGQRAAEGQDVTEQAPELARLRTLADVYQAAADYLANEITKVRRLMPAQ